MSKEFSSILSISSTPNILLFFLIGKTISDLESELQDSRVVRDSLKAYILKLENQPKPKPRKNRRRK